MTCPFCHHKEHLPGKCGFEFVRHACPCCPTPDEILEAMDENWDRLHALQRAYVKAVDGE